MTREGSRVIRRAPRQASQASPPPPPPPTMLATTPLFLLSLLPFAHAADTTLGVFVFHRHGDRTSKAWPPTHLTDLGYSQVHAAGSYFRSKYITDASSAISGIAPSKVNLAQLSVEAPVDTVLQVSAQGFTQALYPPVGAELNTQTLANGTKIEAPLNGYQLIPVNLVTSASQPTADSENSPWLQGASGCPAALTSSNEYFFSAEFAALDKKTRDFYAALAPVVESTFDKDFLTFKNAYSIYDYINVATINNATIPSSNLLTPSVLSQLRTLANAHEFGLAFNTSSPIRAISGATLAAQVLEHLDATLSSKGKTKLGIQFGAYGTFLSFFGLAQLPAANEDFTGVVDYASSITFEMFTSKTVAAGSFPAEEDISVRFLASNGSAAEVGQTAYPLFGQKETALPYKTFVSEMGKFAIGDQKSWCEACGKADGVCAQFSASSSAKDGGAGAESSAGGGSGVSRPVAGVIGALVAVVAVLGLQALALVAGKLRVNCPSWARGALAFEELIVKSENDATIGVLGPDHLSQQLYAMPWRWDARTGPSFAATLRDANIPLSPDFHVTVASAVTTPSSIERISSLGP
ncbi:hypothetical protein V493_06167 [Pseudogymnoascus sp. VKM F-4281 (FW-2241)]|nr:hypothetical protein V493_06167 [Pseudogymnoascus sp. VKM F-4281 (FW-2241)]